MIWLALFPPLCVLWCATRGMSQKGPRPRVRVPQEWPRLRPGPYQAKPRILPVADVEYEHSGEGSPFREIPVDRTSYQGSSGPRMNSGPLLRWIFGD